MDEEIDDREDGLCPERRGGSIADDYESPLTGCVERPLLA